MIAQIVILIVEAMAVYMLVLGAHSLRRRYGHALFYALLGGLTAIMSWVTDAGVKIQVFELTFVVGSTVFYTSLLLGVFVVYVFDGPRRTRIAISTVAVVSILGPVVAAVLHYQMGAAGNSPIAQVPMPSLRINAASVAATLIDMIFLAIAWEYFGKPSLKMRLGLRTFLTLLGVMWLDVVLFTTGAFAGSAAYFSIMTATLLDRLAVTVFALPFLYGYLHWQSTRAGNTIENRPVLAILKRVAEMESELTLARNHIDSLSRLLPICAICKKIRDVNGDWHEVERYIASHSKTEFSHGICPECARRHYPEFDVYGPEKG
jgi:uncharacterized PurR-regulated membrane protein YhhQ (DUF165 family)